MGSGLSKEDQRLMEISNNHRIKKRERKAKTNIEQIQFEDKIEINEFVGNLQKKTPMTLKELNDKKQNDLINESKPNFIVEENHHINVTQIPNIQDLKNYFPYFDPRSNKNIEYSMISSKVDIVDKIFKIEALLIRNNIVIFFNEFSLIVFSLETLDFIEIISYNKIEFITISLDDNKATLHLNENSEFFLNIHPSKLTNEEADIIKNLTLLDRQTNYILETNCVSKYIATICESFNRKQNFQKFIKVIILNPLHEIFDVLIELKTFDQFTVLLNNFLRQKLSELKISDDKSFFKSASILFKSDKDKNFVNADLIITKENFYVLQYNNTIRKYQIKLIMNSIDIMNVHLSKEKNGFFITTNKTKTHIGKSISSVEISCLMKKIIKKIFKFDLVG